MQGHDPWNSHVSEGLWASAARMLGWAEGPAWPSRAQLPPDCPAKGQEERSVERGNNLHNIPRCSQQSWFVGAGGTGQQ